VRRRDAGFTLVELLLAITLMGLLLALAYGGLRAGWKASESGQRMLEQSGKLRITHQFIRKQLNLMLPLPFPVSDEQDGENYNFAGQSSQVIFVGPMPGYLARGGPQVQRMAFVDGENGLDLLFSHAPLQEFEFTYLMEAEPVVLLEGLQSGQFEFLELDEEGFPIGWTTEWPDPVMMPRAVRLNLQFPEDYVVHWPQLVATVRMDPLAIMPGAGANQTYAERIQDMIRNQSSRNGRDGER
jgi:general secretion pathway protein J